MRRRVRAIGGQADRVDAQMVLHESELTILSQAFELHEKMLARRWNDLLTHSAEWENAGPKLDEATADRGQRHG